MRRFAERKLNFTSYAVGMAVARNPEGARAMAEAGHEIASHGWRWIDYQKVPVAVERKHMRLAIDAIEKACGQRPLGWYTGRVSPNTRKLVVEDGGFLYDSDAYNDELPYWVHVAGWKHLVIPYTMDANDMKFSVPSGIGSAVDFEAYLKAAFNQLYDEGGEAPGLLSIGLHPRIAGRPARARALAGFLDHILGHDRVWVCRRIDVARHWHAEHQGTATAGDAS